MARSVGAVIGRLWKKAYQACKEATGYYSKRKPFEDKWLWTDVCRRRYQNGIHFIHKAIHPFDEQGQLKSAKAIEKEVIKGIIQIEKQALRLESELSDKARMKTFEQIPQILQGVKQWQDWLEQRLESLVHSLSFEDTTPLKDWLLNYLIPCRYWPEILRRTSVKKKNERLIIYYRKLIETSRLKWRAHPLTMQLSDDQIDFFSRWADKVVASFQRSSSQVEGRNGYLAFVHQANRGIPKQRLEVLTIVHNFDIRRFDGSTPAERLFDRRFPNLFEFILQNVKDFPEPRKARNKSPA